MCVSMDLEKDKLLLKQSRDIQNPNSIELHTTLLLRECEIRLMSTLRHDSISWNHSIQALREINKGCCADVIQR